MVDRSHIAPENNPQIMVADTANGVNFQRVEQLGNFALDVTSQTESVAIQRLHQMGYPHVRYINDEATDSTIIVAGNAREIVVSARQWDSINDLNTVSYIYTQPSALRGEIYNGYYDVLHNNNDRVLNSVASAIQEFSDKEGGRVPVHFASMSMGGAVSSALFAEYKGKPEQYPFAKDIKTVLTFGSLRPGDSEFSEKYQEACNKSLVECVEITNANDFLPLISPLATGVGRHVILEEDGSVTKDADGLDDARRMLLTTSNPLEPHYRTSMLPRIKAEAEAQRLHTKVSGCISVGEGEEARAVCPVARADTRPHER